MKNPRSINTEKSDVSLSSSIEQNSDAKPTTESINDAELVWIKHELEHLRESFKTLRKKMYYRIFTLILIYIAANLAIFYLTFRFIESNTVKTIFIVAEGIMLLTFIISVLKLFVENFYSKKIKETLSNNRDLVDKVTNEVFHNLYFR